LLFPSAHNFISAVEENVNVLVRAIAVPTPTPTPCLFPSPAWTAFVCEPRGREVVFEREGLTFIVLPFCGRIGPRQAPIWAGKKRVLATGYSLG
jgi:hypothetical protein